MIRFTPARLALALTIGTFIIDRGPGVHVARYAFMLGAVVCALWILARDRISFVQFAIWIYVITPLARRILDMPTGYTPVSIVMSTPAMVALIALPLALSNTAPVRPRIRAAFTLAIVFSMFGLAVGVVRTGPTAPLGALLEWLAPPILGLFIATAIRDGARLRRELVHTLTWTTLIMAVYGIYQYFYLPVWDKIWLNGSGLQSVGFAVPQNFRVWSTLNSPGPFAAFLGASLIVVAAGESRARTWALALGYPAFALTLVRSGWIGWAVATLIVGVFGAKRVGRRSPVVLALAAVSLLFFAAGLGDSVINRFSESVTSGRKDESLSERIKFHEEMAPRILSVPVGAGLGSTGVAARLAGDTSKGPERFTDFDGGAIEIGYELGGVLGVVYLIVLIAAVLSPLKRARSLSRLDLAATVAAIGLAVQLLFGNPIVGVSGVAFWMFLALPGRYDDLPESDGDAHHDARQVGA